jgi:hypothetical protein
MFSGFSNVPQTMAAKYPVSAVTLSEQMALAHFTLL